MIAVAFEAPGARTDRPAEAVVTSEDRHRWRETAVAEINSKKHYGAMLRCTNWIWKRAPKERVDYDEIWSSVHEWAAEAVNRYDGSQAIFHTWLVQHLRMRARNYLRHLYGKSKIDKSCQAPAAVPLEELCEVNDDPAASLCLQELEDGLTPETRFIFNLMILHKAAIVHSSKKRKKMNWNRVAAYLAIPPSAVHAAVAELREKRSVYM